MKRKIVQHGSSSLTVTLPVKWVQKFSIKKGDEVDVEETGPVVLISTQKETSSPKKVLDTAEWGIFVKNNLSHLYHLGYDELEIKYDNPKVLEDIKRGLPECVGFEIIDQKENKVIIKSIATTLESEFDNILRKCFLILKEMCSSIENCMDRKEFHRLEDIKSMELLNNKFTDMCIRILNKKGYKKYNRTMQVLDVVKNVERVGDELKHICECMKDEKRMDPEMRKLSKEAFGYFDMFYSFFYRFDIESRKKIYENRKTISLRLMKHMEKSRGVDSILTHHLLNVVEKTYDASNSYIASIL
jgi:phosphate uptake regulator